MLRNYGRRLLLLNSRPIVNMTFESRWHSDFRSYYLRRRAHYQKNAHVPRVQKKGKSIS